MISLANTVFPVLPSNLYFDIGIVSIDDQFDVLRLTVVSGEEMIVLTNGQIFEIPEPATLGLFGLALLGFGYRRFRDAR